MNKKMEARDFAISAHYGQFRKYELDKPAVIHPLAVGNLLEEYGLGDNVIAAGYLHDVVEDTKYTIYDIKEKFGNEIAYLVETATEKDKSLSWEDRKKETIERIRNIPLDNKLLICADKICNLDDIKRYFYATGTKDFSLFKRGIEAQKWYFESVYDSLMTGIKEHIALFEKLKDLIDIVFYDKSENDFLEHIIFNNNQNDYRDLRSLSSKREELQLLKKIIKMNGPIVIEFTGTPRTGKTTTICNLYDFFKKGGFDIAVVEEFVTSKNYKERFKKNLDGLSKYDINIAIALECEKQLKKFREGNYDIILLDRSLFDRIVWMKRLFNNNVINMNEYREFINYYKGVISRYIDIIFMMYTDSYTALRREYINSISLDERRFLNLSNLEQYNKALLMCEEELESLSINKINSIEMDVHTQSKTVCDKVLIKTREKYLEYFKNNYRG